MEHSIWARGVQSHKAECAFESLFPTSSGAWDGESGYSYWFSLGGRSVNHLRSGGGQMQGPSKRCARVGDWVRAILVWIYPSFLLRVGSNCQDPRVRNFQKHQVITVGLLRWLFVGTVSSCFTKDTSATVFYFILLPMDFIRHSSCSDLVISFCEQSNNSASTDSKWRNLGFSWRLQKFSIGLELYGWQISWPCRVEIILLGPIGWKSLGCWIMFNIIEHDISRERWASKHNGSCLCLSF